MVHYNALDGWVWGPTIEINTRKIVARLEREGWVNVGGGSLDRFTSPDRPDLMIVVPRHRDLSPGVARSIAKAAGWT